MKETQGRMKVLKKVTLAYTLSFEMACKGKTVHT